MEKKTEIFFINGSSIPIEVMKCAKCEQRFTKLSNVDEIKRHLKPSFMDRLRKVFSGNLWLDSNDGKLL
ncbi:MAG: hypothetical protein HZB67_03115 [Candidatus Aenigmarchaeota archaeon]|nr:hypothetical protein [Candidatus Aenigmarchaeota archaeon]